VSVALVIQHTMQCAILSPMASSALQYFYTLPHKLPDVRQKKNY